MQYMEVRQVGSKAVRMEPYRMGSIDTGALQTQESDARARCLVIVHCHAFMIEREQTMRAVKSIVIMKLMILYNRCHRTQ